MLNTGSEITERTKVVIVGAGIAGLAAARTLEEANFKDYLLLEGPYAININFYFFLKITRMVKD